MSIRKRTLTELGLTEQVMTHAQFLDYIKRGRNSIVRTEIIPPVLGVRSYGCVRVIRKLDAWQPTELRAQSRRGNRS